jgi:hypothetical protein
MLLRLLQVTKNTLKNSYKGNRNLNEMLTKSKCLEAKELAYYTKALGVLRVDHL